MFGKVDGGLHHDGSHELVVLMVQEVAVVDVAGVLNDLVLVDVEVGVVFAIQTVICLCPTDANLQDLEGADQSNFFPSFVPLGNKTGIHVSADVLVQAVT